MLTRTSMPAEPTRPDLAATRADVDLLLAARLAQLHDLWSAGPEVAGPWLGARDVPRLLTDLVFDGGERLRPLVLRAGWALAGGHEDTSYDHVVTLGAALELLHASARIQDDVLASAGTYWGAPALRRRDAQRHREAHSSGDPERPQRYADGVAVLAGDLAHAEAAELVAHLPGPLRHAWRRLRTELVRGLARDLSRAARPGSRPELEHAWDMARARSGADTVQRPLELGCLAAAATHGIHARVSQVGRLIGEAFALRAEILGVWGGPGATGKPVGDALRQGTGTVLVALADRRLHGPEAEALGRLIARTHDEDDVHLVGQAMVRHRVRDDAEEMIARRVRIVRGLLRAPELDQTGVDELLAVTDMAVGARP